MGILLAIVAVILLYITSPFCITYALLKGLSGKSINRYFLSLATSIDQMGNVIGEELFNDVFIKKTSINRFGNVDETISSTLGKNKKANTLTFIGRCLSAILNALDKDHVERAIEK